MKAGAKLFGHPIHQMLIVFPLGLLATSVVFDIIHLATGSPMWGEVSFWMIAAGVIGGLLAAVFGLIDWLAIPVATVAGSVVTGLVVRYLPVMYLGVTLMLIPWLWFRFGDWPHLVYAAVVNVCFWTASIPELREYLNHRRLGDFSGSKYFLGTGERVEGPLLKVIRRWKSRRGNGD